MVRRLIFFACWLGLWDAPPPAAEEFGPSLAELRTARCLARAGIALGTHRQELIELRAALEAGRPAELDGRAPPARGRLRSHDLPADLFGRFDGSWQGRFGKLSVRHLWASLDEATQLVVIDDAGVPREGINLVDEEGTICGLVVGGGAPRLHVGRWRGEAGHLEWTTEHRRYEESVRGPAHAPRYQIVERALDSDDISMRAEYRRPGDKPCHLSRRPEA